MIRRLADSEKQLYMDLTFEFYNSDAVIAPVPEKFRLAAFDELMRSDEYLECYIFEYDGAIAGYGLLSRSFSPEAGGTVIWVEELYLRPGYRGRGLGGEFLDYIEKHVPAARYRLEIEPDNFRAGAMYKRHGYGLLPYSQMVKNTRGKS